MEEIPILRVVVRQGQVQMEKEQSQGYKGMEYTYQD